MPRTNETSITIDALKPGDAAACEAIARAMPAWFGVEEGIDELRHAAATQPGFAVRTGDALAGFLTMERHFPETWEITWMAVHPAHHRRGVGRAPIEAAVARCRDEGARWLLVKTLADTHPSEEYAQTRAFYAAMGFDRLQVFPDLWGEHNPCLLLARPVA